MHSCYLFRHVSYLFSASATAFLQNKSWILQTLIRTITNTQSQPVTRPWHGELCGRRLRPSFSQSGAEWGTERPSLSQSALGKVTDRQQCARAGAMCCFDVARDRQTGTRNMQGKQTARGRFYWINLFRWLKSNLRERLNCYIQPYF